MRIAWAAVLTALVGCGDDSHKGTPSSGPPASASTEPAKPQTRIVYSPGSPIATMGVAQAFRARLKPLGFSEQAIKIGGEQVHVEVPTTKVDEVTKALEGGRLELHLAHADDAFADDPAAHSAKFSLHEEKGPDGSKARFLSAPVARRDALQSYLGGQPIPAKGLVGPFTFDAGAIKTVRSFYVDAERTIRGELVEGAKAMSEGETHQLELTFRGNGRNFIRFHSKRDGRFVVRIDGDVIGVLQSAKGAEITDGKLRLTLADRGGSELTAKAAKELASALDGRAVSHLVKLEKKRDL